MAAGTTRVRRPTARGSSADPRTAGDVGVAGQAAGGLRSDQRAAVERSGADLGAQGVVGQGEEDRRAGAAADRGLRVPTGQAQDVAEGVGAALGGGAQVRLAGCGVRVAGFGQRVEGGQQQGAGLRGEDAAQADPAVVVGLNEQSPRRERVSLGVGDVFGAVGSRTVCRCWPRRCRARGS